MRREDGFTLIELAVVAVILATLLAVAALVLLGARQRAQNVASQAALRQAIIAGVLVVDANEGVVPPQVQLLAELALTEPDIGWKSPVPADIGEVSTSAGPAHIFFASGSGAGDCHYVRLEVDGTFLKHRQQAAACQAQDAAGIVDWMGW